MNLPIFTPNFECIKCRFVTANKKDFGRHLLTRKHQMANEANFFTPNEFACKCGKVYKHITSLCKHKKTCETAKNLACQENEEPLGKSDVEPSENNNLIVKLLKQNEEFKDLIVKQNKQLLNQNEKLIELAGKPNTINNTTNNKFNLNVFLNEQCKDALNIMEFVQSLQIEMSELETIGKLGYAEGISKIFLKGLKELDIYKRPIHCSDLKREVLYVKDQDAWEKENDDKTKLKQAIKQIEHKNIKNIPEWINRYPDSKYADSPKNEQYMKIISNSMGGSTNEEDERNYNKIIKKLANEVIIEKEKEK
jgi:hypothetical protein